jgi:hypothetical protein
MQRAKSVPQKKDIVKHKKMEVEKKVVFFKMYVFVKERNVLHRVKMRNANWIGHILSRNCLIRHVIEGKTEGWMEVKERRRRRRTQFLDELTE